MSQETSEHKLPPRLVAAAWICLGLSTLVVMNSTQEAVTLFNLGVVREQARLPAWPGVNPQMVERMWSAQLQALEGMRTSRILVLSALTLCCVLSLMCAARLLWPAGLPREPMRQMLSGSALAAGILRTLDGAQYTVVMRRTAAAMATSFFENDPAGNELARAVWPALAMGMSIFWTVLVAGTFVLIGQYLRSERVRQLLAE